MDILVEFFSPVFSKWMQQPANPLLAAGSSGTTVLAGRMQRAEGRFVGPSLKGARGILDVLVLNRRVLEVLVWNRTILIWSRRVLGVQQGIFLYSGAVWSIHPVLASWGGEGGILRAQRAPCAGQGCGKAREHIPLLLLLPCLEELLRSFGVMPSSLVLPIPEVLGFPNYPWHLSLFSLAPGIHL